jgi:hypothetical protein
MKTLSAMLVLNKRTRELVGCAVNPMRVHALEEEKKEFTIRGSSYMLSCVTDQWTYFLFFCSIA